MVAIGILFSGGTEINSFETSVATKKNQFFFNNIHYVEI